MNKGVFEIRAEIDHFGKLAKSKVRANVEACSVDDIVDVLTKFIFDFDKEEGKGMLGFKLILQLLGLEKGRKCFEIPTDEIVINE